MPRPQRAWRLCRPLVAIALVWGSASAAVGQPITTWLGAFGDWEVPANWSAGVPTAAHTAEIGGVVVFVNQPGGSCAQLLVGVDQGPPDAPFVNVFPGGSLSVGGLLHVAVSRESNFLQDGSVSAGELRLGSPFSGTLYHVLPGGELIAGSVHIGSTNPAETSNLLADGRVTITGSLFIEFGSGITVPGATFRVGTVPSDDVIVNGVFQYLGLGGAADVALTRFTMSPTGSLWTQITPLGISAIVVTGPAVLDGTLFINDAGAANGTYELLRANPLSGTFAGSQAPPDWSWRIEGNSLLLQKGSTPVEETSWSELKERYRP
ncbi:MAG: hypothetical protein FJ189_01460 [Gammaproteobacteria bacterium]|nr:hypothetical protein [bacterium]MBM4199939.1 hypothetical protein [Gammaproteobacteria bacterium]